MKKQVDYTYNLEAIRGKRVSVKELVATTAKS